MTRTFVVRVWLPDRPGALGAVTSRIGAVRGDVVGIEILERGGGRAVDELVVELPEDDLVGLLVAEIGQVDGVDVEDVRPVAEALHDPRLDALETAAHLVSATTIDDLADTLPGHAARTVGAAWAALVDIGAGEVLASTGDLPPVPWLVSFMKGSGTSGTDGCHEVVWTPLRTPGHGLVLGRDGTPFRAKERRQAQALARIADRRWRELQAAEVAESAAGGDGYSVAQLRARSTARSHRA